MEVERPPSRIPLSWKPRPLQHALQHWAGRGGSLPPGAQCSSQARGIWGSSHSPSWLWSPTSLFLTGSRAGAFSVSRLFYSCRSPGWHQSPHECPTAALVSAPDLSCSPGGLSSTWPLGPLVTSSLPGPPGVFPFLEVWTLDHDCLLPALLLLQEINSSTSSRLPRSHLLGCPPIQARLLSDGSSIPQSITHCLLGQYL